MRSPAIFVQSVCCPCPQLYSSLPVPCRAALRRPLGFLFSATSASSAHSALTLLLASCYLFAVICYPLPPRNQPIFLPPKKKTAEALAPAVYYIQIRYQPLFFTSPASCPLG